MKTKQELIDNLAKVITVYSEDKEVVNKMLEVYLNKKMVVRSVGLIFKGQLPLNNLSETEQGVWCVYLYDITNEKLINPEEYFTDNEIYEIRYYIEKNQLEKRMDEVTLKNVIRVLKNGKTEYRCAFVDYYMLYNINSNRLLTYNFKTQREAKLEKYNNRIIKQANINMTSVNEIADLILNNKFEGNMLTFNLRRPTFSTEGITFKPYKDNPDLGDLTIKPNPEKGIFWDVIDGQHRYNGCIRAIEESVKLGKTLEGGFMLKIPIFNEDEAQDFISNQSKLNIIDKEHVQSFAKDYINTFVKMLNNFGDTSTNKMHDMIANTLEEVKIYNKYTSVNILHDAFKLTELKFDDPFTNEMYLKLFIEVFNTILGYYKYQYKNDEFLIKKETILFEPNAFVLYVSLGNELLNNDKSKEDLLNMLQNNEINLYRDAYDWDSIDLYKSNPRSFKRIFEYFKNIIK